MAPNNGSQLRALKEQIFRLETELLNEKNASETLKKKNDELFKALSDSHLEAINDSNSLPEGVLNELAEKDETIKALQKNLSELSKKFVELKSDLEKSQENDSQSSSDSELLPDLYEQLEEWQIAFFEQENTLKDYVEQITHLSEQVDAIEKSRALTEQSLKFLQDAHESLDGRYADLEDSYAELLAFKENHQELTRDAVEGLDNTVNELRQSLLSTQQEIQGKDVDLMKEQEERASLESELCESREELTELKNSQSDLEGKLKSAEEELGQQRAELIDKRRERKQIDEQLEDAKRLRGNLESSLNTLNVQYEELKKDHREASRGFNLNKSVFAVVVSLVILGILMGFAFSSLMTTEVEGNANLKKISLSQIDSALFSAFSFEEGMNLRVNSKKSLSDHSLKQDLRMLTTSLKKLNGTLEVQLVYPVKNGDSSAQRKAFFLYRSLKKLLNSATVTLELKEDSEESLALLVRLYERKEYE